MGLLAEYEAARREEGVARLRRALALRAMIDSGLRQREVADSLGISQPAVSQQLRGATRLGEVRPAELLEAAAPVLRALADESGFRRLAVFGSIARGESTANSDIDLIVEAPEGASTFDFLRFKQLLEKVLGREIDLVEYGGLTPGLDDDVIHDLELL